MELLGFLTVVVIGGFLIIPNKVNNEMDDENEEKKTETE